MLVSTVNSSQNQINSMTRTQISLIKSSDIHLIIPCETTLIVKESHNIYISVKENSRIDEDFYINNRTMTNNKTTALTENKLKTKTASVKVKWHHKAVERLQLIYPKVEEALKFIGLFKNLFK